MRARGRGPWHLLIAEADCSGLVGAACCEALRDIKPRRRRGDNDADGWHPGVHAKGAYRSGSAGVAAPTRGRPARGLTRVSASNQVTLSVQQLHYDALKRNKAPRNVIKGQSLVLSPADLANPAHQGWLTKLGGHGIKKNWRQRWFVLKDFCLYYFKTPDVRLCAARHRTLC